eukprot:symbB.v1.2.002488.t1/scaffold131.1/size310497/8
MYVVATAKRKKHMPNYETRNIFRNPRNDRPRKDLNAGVEALRVGMEEFKDDVTSKARGSVATLAESPARMQKLLTHQMDEALARHDNHMVNQLLDNAMANHLIGSQAPSIIRSAAQQQARRQLREAIDCEDPKRLKGALVAAKRLNATELPEFEEAVSKYKDLRKLPVGWDVSLMVLKREGGRMVAKLELEDPNVRARFQRLLDLTHRKVYTRDRNGDTVPDRLQLLTVSAVTNDESWAHYVARREAVRREIDSDITDYQRYDVDTLAKSSGDPELDSQGRFRITFDGGGQRSLSVSWNQCKIKTHDFRINLAGCNAGTLYGRGIYFAENGTKSDEYTTPDSSGIRHLLICRVTLGRIFYTDLKDTDPRACEDACLKGKFHSILGDRKKCRGTFREFVVFDEEQVYTNYMLTYRRVIN